MINLGTTEDENIFTYSPIRRRTNVSSQYAQDINIISHVMSPGQKSSDRGSLCPFNFEDSYRKIPLSFEV